ncbi:MAG: hypothetical protein LBV20_05015 [Treponema sp.]|nr:hypothetical protein [Treponema sp.]
MEEIAEKLEEINTTLQKMLKRIGKPKDKADSVLERILTTVGIFSIINIVDVIRRWIIGG